MCVFFYLFFLCLFCLFVCLLGCRGASAKLNLVLTRVIRSQLWVLDTTRKEVVCLSVCLFVCMFVCLYVCLFVCLFLLPSFCHTSCLLFFVLFFHLPSIHCITLVSSLFTLKRGFIAILENFLDNICFYCSFFEFFFLFLFLFSKI